MTCIDISKQSCFQIEDAIKESEVLIGLEIHRELLIQLFCNLSGRGDLMLLLAPGSTAEKTGMVRQRRHPAGQREREQGRTDPVSTDVNDIESKVIFV
jgi:hypothetical protein